MHLGRLRVRHTRGRARPERLLDRGVDGMELVVARDLLGDRAAARVLEHDEVADEVEEPPVLEHTLQQDAELRHRGRGVGGAVDRAPGLEPFLARAERADARRGAVRRDEDAVRLE